MHYDRRLTQCNALKQSRRCNAPNDERRGARYCNIHRFSIANDVRRQTLRLRRAQVRFPKCRAHEHHARAQRKQKVSGSFLEQ